MTLGWRWRGACGAAASGVGAAGAGEEGTAAGLGTTAAAGGVLSTLGVRRGAAWLGGGSLGAAVGDFCPPEPPEFVESRRNGPG